MKPDLDAAVIGAGVVGLAVAAELSKRHSVAVLERHGSYGLENSSHNSGVVHAGLYYPPQWLRTRLCTEGNRLLYDWAAEQHVRIRQTGKLILATKEGDLLALRDIARAAEASGVKGVSEVTQREVHNLEPLLHAVGGLFSATSGVIDQMGLMRSYLQRAVHQGAHVAFKHEVVDIQRGAGGFLLTLNGPDQRRTSAGARYLVNSAGLQAERIGSLLGYDPDGSPETPVFRQYINRGRYYDVTSSSPAASIRHLVYPVPPAERAGLGVHLTVDIDGDVHLGPDSEWLPQGSPLDFRSLDEGKGSFLEAAREYIPALGDDDLVPGQVGYRTKLQAPGRHPEDFLIWADRGYVHLGGIESPGLTASLAIGKYVAQLLRVSARPALGTGRPVRAAAPA